MKFLLFFISFNTFAINYFPNDNITTGSFCSTTNPHYRESRYVERIPICKRVVSKSKRNKIYKLYGIPKSEQRNYTVDHFYPLSLGGDNSISNLWPQHKSVYTGKLEYAIYTYLKKDKIEFKKAIWFMEEIKRNKNK